MTKLIPNNEILTKSDFFPSDIFKSDIIPFHIKKKTLKYFNDLQNRNFVVCGYGKSDKVRHFSMEHVQI